MAGPMVPGFFMSIFMSGGSHLQTGLGENVMVAVAQETVEMGAGEVQPVAIFWKERFGLKQTQCPERVSLLLREGLHPVDHVQDFLRAVRMAAGEPVLRLAGFTDLAFRAGVILEGLF